MFFGNGKALFRSWSHKYFSYLRHNCQTKYAQYPTARVDVTVTVNGIGHKFSENGTFSSIHRY